MDLLSSKLNLILYIDFSKPIGKQSFSMGNRYEDIYKEVIDSKTFCFFEDIEVMKKNGLAKGGTLENAIVIKNEKFMNANFNNDINYFNDKSYAMFLFGIFISLIKEPLYCYNAPNYHKEV